MRRYFVLLILFLSAYFITSCGSSEPEIIPDDLTEYMETAHFKYYYSKGDAIVDTVWMEAFYEWLVDTLEIQVNSKLEYCKYKNREHLAKMTGYQNTNGRAEIGTFRFHVIEIWDNHECVHSIVINLVGHPPALFNEGIAVAHSADPFKYPQFIPSWSRRDIHLWAKDYKNSGQLPALDNLLESTSASFFNYSSNITYPAAGSFVRYLIDNYGISNLKTFISESTFGQSASVTRTKFNDVYGNTVDNLWNEWLTYIENYQ